MSFIAKKSEYLFSDRLSGDYKKKLASKLYRSKDERTGVEKTDSDDEEWTMAELEASNCADHTLKRQNSQRAGDDVADSNLKSK